VGKGEQTRMFGSPCRETLYNRFHQSLADTPIPEVRTHGQRTEESHAAPVGDEVRPGELAVDLRCESSSLVCPPPRAHVGSISQETRRVREAKEGSESKAHGAIGFRKIVFF
jgi:hypothetical protein